VAQNDLASDMGFSGLSQRAVSLWPGMDNNLSCPSTTRLSLTLSNYSTSPLESVDCVFFFFFFFFPECFDCFRNGSA